MCFGIELIEYKREKIVIKRSINTVTINDISSRIHNIDWQYIDYMNTNEADADVSHTINNIINHIRPEIIVQIPWTFI